MSQETTVQRSPLFAAAATAISAAGLIVVPAPAQALPACVQFGFPGDVQLRQSDGWNVTFSSVGSIASGPAQARHDTGGTLSGTVAGGIEGRNINVVINWNNGSRGRYTGVVGDDYHMSGDSVDINPESDARAKYRSVFPISCLTTADPKPAEPPPVPATRTAFVDGEDVDVYDVPDGDKGNILGILQKDKGVQVNADCKPASWCLVSGVAVPTGQGWIWGHLRFE